MGIDFSFTALFKIQMECTDSTLRHGKVQMLLIASVPKQENALCGGYVVCVNARHIAPWGAC